MSQPESVQFQAKEFQAKDVPLRCLMASFKANVANSLQFSMKQQDRLASWDPKRMAFSCVTGFVIEIDLDFSS